MNDDTLKVRRRAMDHLAKMAKHIVDNDPDVACSLTAASLLVSLSTLYPRLWAEFGRITHPRFRQYHGLCCECGNVEMPVEECHGPICEKCEIKLIKIADEISREMDDDDDDDE